MKGQRGEGEASRPMAASQSVDSASRRTGRSVPGRSGTASRWVFGALLLEPSLDSEASGANVASPLVLPAQHPGFISALLLIRGPCVLERVAGGPGILRAHVPPAILGAEVTRQVEDGVGLDVWH